MHVGHVAVVSRVIGPREVLVDQANWVRGRVTKAMSVVDASPLNDWTSVKVLEPHSGTHGRENPTFGFIYPGVLPASFGETIVEPQQPDRHRSSRAAHRAEPRSQDEVITEAPARDHSHAVSVVRSAHAADHRVPAEAHEAEAARRTIKRQAQRRRCSSQRQTPRPPSIGRGRCPGASWTQDERRQFAGVY